jgi:hypothetical protein
MTPGVEREDRLEFSVDRLGQGERVEAGAERYEVGDATRIGVGTRADALERRLGGS